MLRFLYLLALIEDRSDQLVTVLSVAIYVFVGVDSNPFRYVLDFEVTIQGLHKLIPRRLTAE